MFPPFSKIGNGMQSASGTFHFPSEISLGSSPLLEAWLELRWLARPKPDAAFQQIPAVIEGDVDPFFQFALGTIYRNIRDHYPISEFLPANNTPIPLAPHTVRLRFKRSENEWPVMQFGPGAATVNFTKPFYSWTKFRAEVTRLRKALLDAYDGAVLEPQAYLLRYRNAFELQPPSDDVLVFLHNKLNITAVLPPHVPGWVAGGRAPSDVNFAFRFELDQPTGAGTLRLGTGYIRDQADPEAVQGKRVVLAELEALAQGSQAPPLSDEAAFTAWLEAAHAFIHEWFFALINGPLRGYYEQESI